MDQWLSEIYGTGGADDLEKTAQHHLLAKLAEEEGIDLSGLDEDQLNALAEEVLTEGDVEEDDYEGDVGDYEEDLQKEAQAKFEEADFLGRVMAHSYTQEIEKIAGAGSWIKNKAVSVGNAARKGGKDYVNLMKGGKRVGDKRVGNTPISSFKGRKDNLYGAGTGSSMGEAIHREALKSHAARGGTALVAGGAAYGAKKKMQKEKKASAFEKLAEMRAQEILDTYGVQDGGQDGDLNEQIDGRALEILQENGYEFDGQE